MRSVRENASSEADGFVAFAGASICLRTFFLFSFAGFKGNLSLLDIYIYFFQGAQANGRLESFFVGDKGKTKGVAPFRGSEKNYTRLFRLFEATLFLRLNVAGKPKGHRPFSSPLFCDSISSMCGTQSSGALPGGGLQPSAVHYAFVMTLPESMVFVAKNVPMK